MKTSFVCVYLICKLDGWLIVIQVFTVYNIYTVSMLIVIAFNTCKVKKKNVETVKDCATVVGGEFEK